MSWRVVSGYKYGVRYQRCSTDECLVQMAAWEEKAGDQSGGGQDRASSVDRKVESRGFQSCWNVGQNLLYSDGFASGWKASFRATSRTGKREARMMERDLCTQSQHKSFPSRTGSGRCETMPKKHALQTHSASFLSFSSVSPLPSSPGPSVKDRPVLREGFVKTQPWYMPWKLMNEH